MIARWLLFVVALIAAPTLSADPKVIFAGSMGGPDVFIDDWNSFIPKAYAAEGCMSYQDDGGADVDKDPFSFPYDEYCGYNDDDPIGGVGTYMAGIDAMALQLRDRLNDLGFSGDIELVYTTAKMTILMLCIAGY